MLGFTIIWIILLALLVRYETTRRRPSSD